MKYKFGTTEISDKHSIQVELEPKNKRIRRARIFARTIKFSEKSPEYVIEDNISYEKFKNIYKDYLIYKKSSEIVEKERKKYSNHVCTDCDYCTDRDNYLSKKITKYWIRKNNVQSNIKKKIQREKDRSKRSS